MVSGSKHISYVWNSNVVFKLQGSQKIRNPGLMESQFERWDFFYYVWVVKKVYKNL